MDRRNDQEEKNKVGAGLKEYAESAYEILIEKGNSADTLRARLIFTLEN
jgi:hypothetical protein